MMAGFFLNVDEYFTKLEDEFGKLRGKAYRATPEAWKLMESWKKRDIPLHVIFRAFDACFASNPDIYSIVYCAKEVEKRYAEWAPSQVGK